MNHTQLIINFYTSFSQGNAEGMVNCYHDQIQFYDPAFGELHGDDAKNMWRMLMDRSKSGIKINFSNVQAGEKEGSAEWQAEYLYGEAKRKVLNKISAQFEFQDGKIIKHTDHFNLWKWSSQALGWKGALLGWSSFMKNKIRQQTKQLLHAYRQRKYPGNSL